MTWRDTFKVHPAAEVFPMLPDDELQKLGEDIKANGIRTPISYYVDRKQNVLIDGRNRLEASERVGYEPREWEVVCVGAAPFDAVRWIISLNIHRRHLTKQQQADLIVAVHMAGDKPRQVGEVSKGGRGKVDEVKAAAVATAEELGIGKRTVERAIAKTVPDEAKRPRSPRTNGTGHLEYAHELEQEQAVLHREVKQLGDAVEGADIERLKEIIARAKEIETRLVEIRLEATRLLGSLMSEADEMLSAPPPSPAPVPESYPELPKFLDRLKG